MIRIPSLFECMVPALFAGCAAHAQLRGTFVRARALPDPPPAAPPPATLAAAATSATPTTVVTAPTPDQRRPSPTRAPASKRAAAAEASERVVDDANKKARAAPDPASYFNAVVQYDYQPGTLYEVYGAPMRVTDVALEPGERILGQPASGDVVRWLLAIGKSMSNGVDQWHVYIKPTRPDLTTNLAINTDRRSYLLELKSFPDTYMAAVVWRYPADELAQFQAQASALATEERSSAPVVSLDSLDFHYSIEVVKGTPGWTPLQVFDDGRKTFIRFPPAMLVREAPALFVLSSGATQLVNYRVKGDTYVVDRLFDAAELRVGQQDQEIVRILRGDPPPKPTFRPIHAR